MVTTLIPTTNFTFGSLIKKIFMKNDYYEIIVKNQSSRISDMEFLKNH
jgi:hypothetical protein